MAADAGAADEASARRANSPPPTAAAAVEIPSQTSILRRPTRRCGAGRRGTPPDSASRCCPW
ncbi:MULTISPECIES: hypothetical protein [Kitasatospora]|uniref:hypothetical protein n=1 Tax=Kitasatospora TaxID=2063 RepID=UPI0031E3D337